MKICKRCLNTMPDDAIFCNQCGGELIDLEGQTVCKNCNALNDPGVNFCKSCGAPLNENTSKKEQVEEIGSIEEVEKGYDKRVKNMAKKIGISAYLGAILTLAAFVILFLSVAKHGSVYNYIKYMQGNQYCLGLYLNIWLLDVYALFIVTGGLFVISLIRIITFKRIVHPLVITLSIAYILAVILLWFSYIYCKVGIEPTALLNAIKSSWDYVLISVISVINLVVQLVINPKEIVV